MSTLDEYAKKFMAMPDEWSLEQWREVATDLAKEKDAEDESPTKKPGRPRINKKPTANYLLSLTSPETWQYRGLKLRGRKRQLYYGYGIEVIADLVHLLDDPIKSPTKRYRLNSVLKSLKKKQGKGFHDTGAVERALRRYKRTQFKEN